MSMITMAEKYIVTRPWNGPELEPWLRERGFIEREYVEPRQGSVALVSTPNGTMEIANAELLTREQWLALHEIETPGIPLVHEASKIRLFLPQNIPTAPDLQRLLRVMLVADLRRLFKIMRYDGVLDVPIVGWTVTSVHPHEDMLMLAVYWDKDDETTERYLSFRRYDEPTGTWVTTDRHRMDLHMQHWAWPAFEVWATVLGMPALLP